MLYNNVKLQNAIVFNVNQDSIREMFAAINDKDLGVKITNVHLETPRFPWDSPLYRENPFVVPPPSLSYSDPFNRYNMQPIYRIAYDFYDEFGLHKDEIIVTDGDFVLFTGNKLVRLNKSQCNIGNTKGLVDVVFDIE